MNSPSESFTSQRSIDASGVVVEVRAVAADRPTLQCVRETLDEHHSVAGV